MSQVVTEIIHVALGTVLGGIILALIVTGLAIYFQPVFQDKEFKMYPERTAQRFLSWGLGLLLLLIGFALYRALR